jgi:hypothetical protein
MTALVALRGEDPPAGSAVVVRGGQQGLDADILLERFAACFGPSQPNPGRAG